MDISAEVAAIQAASQGSELRQPLVGALNKLNSGSLPAVTASDAGKVLKVGANGWEIGEKSGYMPVPSATKQISDNGTYDVTNYSSAIVSVHDGGGPTLITKNITENGTYNASSDNADGYSSVTVNVSSGSPGVYVGTDDPSANIGSNGDYYYKRRLAGTPGYSNTPTNNSGTTMSGYEFVANSNITVIGLRGHVRSATSGRLILADSSGNIIKQITDLSFEKGWNEFNFDTPVQLVSETHYIVVISVSNTHLSYQDKNSASFNASITYVTGKYNALPGNNDPDNVYSADIIMQGGNIYKISGEYYKENGSWIQI